MTTMDIFSNNAFSMVSLTAAINKAPYVPQYLGQLGLFQPVPIRTLSAAIENRDGVLSLIQTSPRGAPPTPDVADKRNIRSVPTVRIAKQATIQASEIQGIRAFGSETELMQVQDELARRLAGDWGLRAQIELTHENMRIGAIQGIVKDADGTTLTDWYTTMGIIPATEVDFNLDAASPTPGEVRGRCDGIVRAMMRAAKGAWAPGTYILALCGDTFWDQLIAHSETRQTYLNQQEANQLREGTAFGTLRYGGITFVNYRGTDDGTTVGIGATKCKFIPVNAPGVFQVYYSPHDSFEYVNTPGLPVYSMIVPDRDRNMWVSAEVYSYPLFVCTRPEMLQSAKNT